jgi:hypothetical protein
MPNSSSLSLRNLKALLLLAAFLSASIASTSAQTPTPEQQMPRTPGFTPSPTPQFAPSPQTSPTPPVAAATTRKNPLELFQYRQIGPFRGGRVTAVAGIPNQPNVYYFGATGGGVYKTTDGGVNWSPVSDEFFKTGSVGAIGVSESDPNVLYVGMANRPCAATSRTATAFINQPTRAKPGSTSAWATRAKSVGCAFIRKTRT